MGIFSFWCCGGEEGNSKEKSPLIKAQMVDKTADVAANIQPAVIAPPDYTIEQIFQEVKNIRIHLAKRDTTAAYMILTRIDNNHLKFQEGVCSGKGVEDDWANGKTCRQMISGVKIEYDQACSSATASFVAGSVPPPVSPLYNNRR